MKLKTLMLGTAVAAGLALSAGQASAALVNGSFETGDFTGWTTAPSFLTGVVSSHDSYAPTDGDFLGLLASGAGTGVYTLLSQTFTVNTGGTLEGDAAFTGHDYLPYDDDGFVRVFDAMTSQTLFFASIGTVGNFGSTPWTHFSTTLGAGTYTVEAGVRNNTDNNFESHLLADNFTLTGDTAGVPEPATWALMIMGFGAAGSMLRRRQQAAIKA